MAGGHRTGHHSPPRAQKAVSTPHVSSELSLHPRARCAGSSGPAGVSPTCPTCSRQCLLVQACGPGTWKSPSTPFLASHCVSRSVRGPFTLSPAPLTAVCTETTARAHVGTKALRRKNKIPTTVWAASDHSMTSSQEYATPLPTSGPQLIGLLSQLPFYVVSHPSERSWRKRSAPRLD